jgi:hypothetical protein
MGKECRFSSPNATNLRVKGKATTVHHKAREFARGPVHINSAEGFNDRILGEDSGVSHYINSHLADLYFNEIGFRWSQRLGTGQVQHRTRKGRQVAKTIWERSRQRSNSRRRWGTGPETKTFAIGWMKGERIAVSGRGRAGRGRFQVALHP